MIERELNDHILTLRLAHGKASAMDVELCEALVRELRDAERSDARAVILTGTGSIFSAGVDLYRMTNEGAAYVERFFPALRDSLHALFTFPKPIVAAVNGHAIAGGCLLAAACDYRLMAAGKIGVPELLVGVPFPAVAIEILKYACGRDAQSLIYSGLTVTPDEAKLAGLIDEVVAPDFLHARADHIARELGAIDGRNFAITKKQLRGAPTADEDVMKMWSAPEVHDHIREYLAKTVGKSRA
ncbi:MAG TPA: enoyl-CoA hydratase/isomerase family protein [Thermoanaerobaculia bacterium]